MPGPNFLYHVDGTDELKPFGFHIHGAVVGFSKKVMWLKVGTSNKKPEVIAFYFLDCLQEFKILPSVISSDKGTKNVLIELLQMALRSKHTDEFAGFKSFRKGKSTSNERVEK